MGEIVTLANTAFRDYATDGVRASGKHKPQKTAIRAVFSAIEAALPVNAATAGLALDNSTDDGADLFALAEDNAGGIVDLAGATLYSSLGIPRNVQFINGTIRTPSEYVTFPAAPLEHPFGGQPVVVEDSEDIHFWTGGCGQLAPGTDDKILRVHIEADRHENATGSPMEFTRSSDGIEPSFRRTLYSEFLIDPRGVSGGMVSASKFAVAFLEQESDGSSLSMQYRSTSNGGATPFTEETITSVEGDCSFLHGQPIVDEDGFEYFFGVRASSQIMMHRRSSGGTWTTVQIKDWATSSGYTGSGSNIAEVMVERVAGLGWFFYVRPDYAGISTFWGFTMPLNMGSSTAWVDSNIAIGQNPGRIVYEWGRLWFVLQAREGGAIGGLENKIIAASADAETVYADGGAVTELRSYSIVAVLNGVAIGYVDLCRLASNRWLGYAVDAETPLGSSNKSRSRIIRFGGDPAPVAAPHVARMRGPAYPLIDNADFSWWTRGDSFSGVTGLTNVADRWKVSSNDGVDVTRVALLGSAYERVTELAPWAPRNAMRLAAATGSGRALVQRVHGRRAVEYLAGRVVTYCMALAGTVPASPDIRAVTSIGVGTGGSGSVTPASTNSPVQDLAGGLNYLGIPTRTPEIDGLTLGEDAYIDFTWLFNASGAIDIHVFGAAPIFGDRYAHFAMRDPAAERAAIRRRVRDISIPVGSVLTVGNRASTDNAIAGLIAFDTMDAAPVITLASGNTYADFRVDDDDGKVLTSLSFTDSSPNQATVLAYKTGEFTAFDAKRITAKNAARLILDAE